MISCKLKVLFGFKFVAKTIPFERGVSLLFAAVNDGILVMMTHFCLFVIQEPENDVLLHFSGKNSRRFTLFRFQKFPNQNHS